MKPLTHKEELQQRNGFGIVSRKTIVGRGLKPVLTLLLLNKTCPVLANSVDPDLLASEEAN